MQRLGDDARRLLAAAGLPDPGPLTAIADVWPGAVGEAIARAAWPRRLSGDGTLHVATVSSTWAFELGRLAPDILERLATAIGATLGGAAPTALRFAPGPVPEPSLAEPTPAEQGVEIDSAERARGAALAGRIADPELRELVARAAAASLARGRSDPW